MLTCRPPHPEKKPKELSRTFHGNGIKINLGVLANSREGDKRQLGCSAAQTDSAWEVPEGTGLPLPPTAAPWPLPTSWGTRADG